MYFLATGKNVPVYGVNDKLADFETGKSDVKAGKDKMPPVQNRMKDEDWYEEHGTQVQNVQTKKDDLMEVHQEISKDHGEAHKTLVAPKGDKATLNDFELKKVIGRGSFGKVFLVTKKDNPNQVFAMKALSKSVILEYDQVKSTELEKQILVTAKHPFLVGMEYVF